MGKRKLAILIGSLLGLCLAVSLAGAAAYYFLNPGREEGPAVLIKAPRHGEEVSSNEIVQVQAIARDQSGVTRLELWVDGELVAVKASQLREGSTPFPLIEGWQPESPGQHTLIVRAFNKALRSGQAAVVVKALDLPKALPTPAYEVREGDTLETIATQYNISGEELAGYNPGLEEPLQAGDMVLIPTPPPEREDPSRPEEAPPEPLPGEEPPDLSGPEGPLPWMALIPGRLIGVPITPTVSLEVEALSLEVDKDYDGVYCYASLAGSAVERVPGEGYLEGFGQRRWDIEAQMGGENRRVVAVPEGDRRLDVMVNCLGYRGSEEGDDISDLGTLSASHFEEEWDGRLIEQMVSGMDGWFRVGYRIRPLGETEGSVEPMVWIDPPTNLTEGVTLGPLGWQFGFYFDYPTGAEETIGGYLIYRNGAAFAEMTHPQLTSRYPDHNRWFAPIRQSDFYPTCPDKYEFFMTAYYDSPLYGRGESMHSNSVFVEGDPVPCYRSKVVMVTFEQLWAYCLNADNCTCSIFSCTNHWNYEGVGCTHECDPDSWAIPDGTVWVNGEKVFHIVQYVESGTKYPLPSTYLYGANSADQVSRALFLGPRDDLTVSMQWWDNEFLLTNTSDSFCAGEYTIGHWELDELAKSPPGERKRTYEPEYGPGGGNCYLKFTVRVWETEE